jgi:hypothetical protein
MAEPAPAQIDTKKGGLARMPKSNWRSRLTTVMPWLRVANSVLCTIVGVAILFFWVRSYSHSDRGVLKIAPSEYIMVHAGDGRMCVWFEHKPLSKWADWWTSPITKHTPPDHPDRIPWFDLAFWPTVARLYTAHCFLLIVVTSLGVAPWCLRRYSLRGLLLGVTMAATFLGLIAWVDRTF